MNLSYPYDERSVNKNIPQDFSTVQYASLNDAISVIQELGPNCYMAKADIADAFRIVPLHPSQYNLTGAKWQGQYYYDKNLPMGCSSSCKIFETISSAIVHILKEKYGVKHIVKILDDFLFIAKTREECARALKSFLDVCKLLNIPINWEKTSKHPGFVIIFVGIELDTIKMVARLPQEKLDKYSQLVQDTLLLDYIRVRQLKSVIGSLQFATTVVRPGKPFLRRLIDCTIGKSLAHFVSLTSEDKLDLVMWKDFLSQYNGVTVIRQTPIINSTSINLFTDASKIGYGGTFGTFWVQGTWPNLQWAERNIAVLELWPIYVLIAMFGNKMANNRVLFRCDNIAIVQVINKQTAKYTEIMTILRPLILCLLKHNIRFRAEHIPGVQNKLSDAISRFQVTPALLKHYGMQSTSTPIPAHLQPSSFNL